MHGAHLILVAFVLAFAAMLLAATFAKFAEVRAASRWPQAEGVVVKSEVEARERPALEAGEAATISSYPLVEYAYEVGKRKLRARRIGIAEIAPNVGIEEALAKYPVGAKVTVYYDPLDPAKAVLERELPAGFHRGMVIVYTATAFVIFGVLFAFTPVVHLLGLALVQLHARYPLPTFVLGSFGAIATLFAVNLQNFARKVRAWPTVTGRIIVSKVEEAWDDSDGSGWAVRTKFFRPTVTYGYEVNGHRYQGNRIAAGRQIAVAGLVASIGPKQIIERYPKGKAVEVRYDPRNPADSLLEARVPGLTILWIFAAALLVGAALFGGWLGNFV